MKQHQLYDEFGEKISPIITLKDGLSLEESLQGSFLDAVALFEKNFNLNNGGTNGSVRGKGIGTNYFMGQNAFAMGTQNVVTGDNASGFGKNNTASAINSSVFGNTNVSSGENSASFGEHNNAKNKNSFICGQYGETNPDTLFAVGCGNATKKKLGFEVKDNGECYVNGTNLKNMLVKSDTDFLGYKVYETEPTEEQLIADEIGPNDIYFVSSNEQGITLSDGLQFTGSNALTLKIDTNIFEFSLNGELSLQENLFSGNVLYDTDNSCLTVDVNSITGEGLYVDPSKKICLNSEVTEAIETLEQKIDDLETSGIPSSGGVPWKKVYEFMPSPDQQLADGLEVGDIILVRFY